jgi:beta-phosphoglucomutase-like phosphatase (HAD superfamily)
MSSKIFDYIFIDLDGPILDGKLRHYCCYKDILNTYGGEAIAINAYWRMKRNRVPRDVILKKSCFQADYQTFLHAWMQNIELPKYLSLDTLKPNVAETLSKWQKLTQKITLVTMRQNRKNLCAQLKKLSIYNHFDEIIDCPPKKKIASI